MADTITPSPLSPAPAVDPKVAANNAEVAAKQAAQDAAGKSGAGDPSDFHAASDALDALAQSVKPVEPPVQTPEEKEAADKAAAETAEAAKKAEEATAAEKAAADEAAKKADDYFKDAPTLPPGAAPKSSEAFATVKVIAAKEIKAREDKIAELQKKYDELEAKAKTPPAELTAAQKELEDHRAWRAKLDVDFDPKFKEFDKGIAATREFVYDQLRKNPAITEEVINEIKKYGGPENVNLTKVFESVKDPVLQQIVQSKIADITMQKYSKDQAIKAAKDNIVQYTQARQQEIQRADTEHTDLTQKELNTMLGALPWFKEKAADGKATDVEKAAVEDHNKFLGTIKSQIAEASKDNSPQMRAILVTGLAQLFNLQREHQGANAELTRVKKELAEVTAKWEKHKVASVNRGRESNAPAAGVPAAPKAPDFNTRAVDALDVLAKSVMETRQAQGK
jgi:hypothetical protein